MNFEQIKLGDAIHVKHGFAFKSAFFSDGDENVVITPGNFHESGGFRHRPGKDRSYTGDIPDGYVLEADDLVVAMTEQGLGLLGSSALIPEGQTYLHNQRIGLVDEIDPEVFDKRFLYYLFNTYNVRGQISGSASGTKVRHTSPERIYRVVVSIPDVKTQQKISETIRDYDDLIENNLRRIALLEEAARLLFREWFVHFRFPGHEHVRIVDGVPEGWQNLTFDDACEAVGGGTPSTKVPEYWENGDVTWITPTDITRNSCLALLDGQKKITELGLKKSSAKMVPPNTILMTSRASIGFFGMIDREVCTNQGFINIIPNDPNHRMYLLFNLLNRVEEIRGHASGSTYAEISKSKFKALPVIVPVDHLVEEFEQRAWEIISQVRVLHTQNLKLAEARDLLLPRLMDGRIEV